MHAEAIDWEQFNAHLDTHGWATLPGLLDADECATLAGLFEQDQLFRTHVVMARHGFGRGDYKYFNYPLPAPVDRLRAGLYPHLALAANRWNALLGSQVHYPQTLAEFLERCHAAGQTRPTPLLLRYGVGDYNCLHQDVYGECVFPLQATLLLAEPERDFSGGEFVLVEQRPRMQSRPMVVPLQRGDGVVFAVNERPVTGARGAYRVKLRHGVSELRAGQRSTLGMIFHDAT